MERIFYKKRVLYPALLALLIVVLIGLYTANYRFSEVSPGGNDFIPRWLGTRLLLTEGLNPYSSESSQRIQYFITGRQINPGEDQHLFVYPLYAVLFFSPFALIENYTIARALWMTWLEVALVIIVILSVKLADFKVSPLIFGFLVLFALFWYYDVRSLINGNPAILGALFVTIGLIAIKYNRDVLGGIFLGFATIKPQIVVLLIPFVILWAYSHRRWRLIIAIAGAVIGLTLLGFLIEPNWIFHNFEQITAYPDYTLPGTPNEIYEQWWPNMGGNIALIQVLAVVSLLIWLWVISWKSSFQLFLLVSMATLASTNLVGIQTATANYVALLPGAILITLYLRDRESRTGKITALLFSGFLLFGVWALFLLTRGGRAQSLALFFPAPVTIIILIGLLIRTKRMNQTVVDQAA